MTMSRKRPARCQQSGCNRKHYSKGLCERHYQAEYRARAKARREAQAMEDARLQSKIDFQARLDWADAEVRKSEARRLAKVAADRESAARKAKAAEAMKARQTALEVRQARAAEERQRREAAAAALHKEVEANKRARTLRRILMPIFSLSSLATILAVVIVGFDLPADWMPGLRDLDAFMDRHFS